jgi:hypothetical protein
VLLQQVLQQVVLQQLLVTRWLAQTALLRRRQLPTVKDQICLALSKQRPAGALSGCACWSCLVY